MPFTAFKKRVTDNVIIEGETFDKFDLAIAMATSYVDTEHEAHITHTVEGTIWHMDAEQE